MSLIIGLIILGIILISFEIIVPGGILGVLGAISIIAACVLALQDYGAAAAIAVFLGSLLFLIIILAIELKYLPKTSLGKKMFLRKSVESHSTQAQGEDSLIGKNGQVTTTLTPSGRIEVDGKEYEAFSEDGLIKKGEAVTVVGRDNFRILVKKLKTS